MKLEDLMKTIDKKSAICFAIFGAQNKQLLGRFSVKDKALKQYFNLEIKSIDLEENKYCKILLENA